MGTQIFLGKPPASIEQWIKDHHGPVVKETTVVKYTAASRLPDWEGDIIGELTSSSIPNRSDIAEVEIGSHVTVIMGEAFIGCSSLASVTIPGSVTDIYEGAFQGCTSLTSVAIPDSVTNIGIAAFLGCSSLASMTIGNNVAKIRPSVFKGCSSLASVTIPDSVTSIGYQAFYDCSRLASVTFSGKDKATVQGMSDYSWGL